MKKLSFVIAIFFIMVVNAFSQTIENQNNAKIDSELWQDMSLSKNDSEMYHVIVVMSKQYDQTAMLQKTHFMDKKSKREFVINEMKRFTGELQADVARVMTERQRDNSVTDFNQFWVFNGFSCNATKDVVVMLASRDDVAFVRYDKNRNMLPEKWDPQPTSERGNAWNVTKVNADDVWTYNGDTGYTGSGVVVAVIDTGVNYNHTDIKNNMWDGGSDYPYHGYDFVNDDNDPIDDQGHGSHCAGTVAGYGTNGTQTGMAKGAKVMALKVLNASGSGYDDDILDAIEFAIEHEADVISMSLGAAGIGGDATYRAAFETVLAAGIPASVAAGNEGDEQNEYPIPYNVGAPGNCPPPYLHPDQKDILSGGITAVISVGATTSADEHSYFTSEGPSTWTAGSYIGTYYDYPYTKNSSTQIGLIRPDIAAPGSSIVSIKHNSNTGYTTMSGTSMATPCNAGVIALMLEANPELTPRNIDSILEYTAVRCEGATKKSNLTGSGRIDAYAAVGGALALVFGGDATNHFVGQLSGHSSWSESSNWANGEKPDEDAKVLISNDVVIDENVTINTLYINTGVEVKVQSGYILNVTNEIQNLAGAEGLVVENDAALITSSANVQATVNRSINNNVSKGLRWDGKWHFVSSPVAAQTFDDFKPKLITNEGLQLPQGHGLGEDYTLQPGEYDLYLYDEPVALWRNIKDDDYSSTNGFFTANGSSNFTPGRGYLVAYQYGAMMPFAGTVNSGEVSMTLTNENSTLPGFNLVGNPYPCSIDWEASNGWTRSVLESGCHIWIYNDDVDQYGVYQLGNEGVGTNGVTNIIASCQGFFVKATSAGTLKMSDDVKTESAGVFRKANNEKTIKIRVDGLNGSDEVMICSTNENISNAQKLFSKNDAVPSLYFNIDGENYSIVNINDDDFSLPLNFLPGNTAKFTMTSSSSIELYDRQTGVATDLSEGYAFSGSVVDSKDRFLIRTKSNSDSFVYLFGDDLIINIKGDVQIIDCLGRVVLNTYVTDGKINVSNLKSGVYIVKVNDLTQKIVIK